MKTEKNILVAFLLNLFFAVFEFFGGIFTGSVAIVSDAIHDIGDAASIGISYLLEKKSKRQPDAVYTYGYSRYSVIGGVLTTLILLVGSAVVTCNAVYRIINPTRIHYDGMILVAVVGVIVNFCAAFLTREGHSLNQKAVNLHMLEDVLGWVVVLIGAVVMRFTELVWIDPVMSIGVALFIFVNAVCNLKAAVDLFLEKTPRGLDPEKIKKHLLAIDGVLDIHHIHVWSLDGFHNYATMHVVSCGENHPIKDKIRDALRSLGIGHVTLELEEKGERCHETHCHVEFEVTEGHGHHHHHH